MAAFVPESAYEPQLPSDLAPGIGLIGAGFIVRDCHLPAYRAAGFNVRAITSRTRARAEELARTFDIPAVYDSPEDVAADPSVEVVDIAVPPDVQPGIIRRIVELGPVVRGILAQKPLAMDLPTAVEIVEACQQAGIVLAVNQNMRYDQSVRAARWLLTEGYLGEPVLATIEMRAIPHWMPWAEGLRSLTTYIMSIHHLDTFRFWLGTPERIFASTRSDPRTRFAHRDGINLYILEYASGTRAAAWDDVWAGPLKEGVPGKAFVRWRIEGTDGYAYGDIGWPAYPARQPSTLTFASRRTGRAIIQPTWQKVWFPDAFVGTMAQLLRALETGEDPEISGLDNLETIALCEAALRSGQEHRPYEPLALLRDARGRGS